MMALCGSGEEGRIHVLGEKSKVANWVVIHIFLVVSILSIFCVLLFLNENAEKLRRILTIIPLGLFGPAFLLRFLWRDRCYRVEFDIDDENIRFFRFFHRDIVEAPVRLVEFRFDRIRTLGISELVCVFAGVRSTVGLEYMFPLSMLLPTGVEIVYADSFWGRLAKKQCAKWIKNHK